MEGEKNVSTNSVLNDNKISVNTIRYMKTHGRI